MHAYRWIQWITIANMSSAALVLELSDMCENCTMDIMDENCVFFLRPKNLPRVWEIGALLLGRWL